MNIVLRKYKNAQQDELWQFLSEQAHRDAVLPLNLDVKMIMDTWTLQMGFPVITIVRNYTDGYAFISQVKFNSYVYNCQSYYNYLMYRNGSYVELLQLLQVTRNQGPSQILSGQNELISRPIGGGYQCHSLILLLMILTKATLDLLFGSPRVNSLRLNLSAKMKILGLLPTFLLPVTIESIMTKETGDFLTFS